MLSKALPHVIAIIIFLVVAIVYCRPTLEGKVVSQSDIAHWNGANKQSLEFKEKHGHSPLWTNSLFSGMPTFMIGYDSNNIIPWKIHSIITLGLPAPIQFFFLACICFYFLAMVLKTNPWVGVAGALAFAYATYNPVIISVGHDTKMWSIAYMPAVLASVLLIFNKKYWLGSGLLAVFIAIMISMNHLQIDYYLFLAIGVMGLFFAVRWIRAKEWKHLAIAVLCTLGASFIGVLTNAVSLLTTYEYQKETIRGGTSGLADTTNTQSHVKGLDKTYAFSYSLKLTEPLVMMFPHLYGGSNDQEEVSQEKSKTIEVLQGFPPELRQQLPVSYYWGGLIETGIGTSGPPYSGVIICFLAILGMFILDNKHKWWIFGVTILTIMLSWGSFFEGFNTFFYDHLPFYNKFRAPSMILVIPQLLLPVLAVLTLQAIISQSDTNDLLKKYKKGLIATGAFFALALILYFSFDYLTTNDRGLLKQVASMNQPQLSEMVREYINALKADRQSLITGDIIKGLVLVALAAGLLFLLIKRKLGSQLALAGLAVLVLIDLLMVDVNYLSSAKYVEPNEIQEVVMTDADRQIKADTGYYRVFNADPNRFTENNTSYFHNSIGGYHAAKLKIYQDLIERQLSGQQPNFQVLNMLNAKYILQTNPQNGQKVAQQNPYAAGPAWLIKHIQYVPGIKQEMNALNNLNIVDTAVVEDKFKSSIPFAPQWDSTASISLVKNENDKITYRFAANANQFAVFSEIYYEAGWKAFIDGKETPIVRVNYVLRGLPVTAGNHQIEFRFEPQGYMTGRNLTTIGSIALILVLLLGVGSEWWRTRKAKQ